MLDNKKQVNIVRGLRTMEWLKNQILTSVTMVFTSLTDGSIDKTVNALADIIISCYLLARRLNVSFVQLEAALEEKVRCSREQGHELERWYGDISDLLDYLRSRRKG